VPVGAVLRTAVAGVTCTIMRDDGGADGDVAGVARSYLLLVDRSYGDYLVDVLIDAGADLGIAEVRTPDE
jgi:sarcosine oxidase gamma subunit